MRHDKCLTPEEIRRLILAHGNEIFAVKFIKRSDGTLREMRCRLHVSKGVKGTGDADKLRRQHERCDTICVYDMDKLGFRTISLDSVVYVSPAPTKGAKR